MAGGAQTATAYQPLTEGAQTATAITLSHYHTQPHAAIPLLLLLYHTPPHAYSSPTRLHRPLASSKACDTSEQLSSKHADGCIARAARAASSRSRSRSKRPAAAAAVYGKGSIPG